jgi:hypothetical protein
MKQKVERVSFFLAERISAWSCVEAIALADSAEFDVYDPYFFISLDVYHRKEIPDTEERLRSYSGAGAFESSSTARKDRFLIEGIPVRVEFKEVGRIDELLSFRTDSFYVFRQTGTYPFHRLLSARILFDRSGWIAGARQTLSSIPDSFWDGLYVSALASAEHYASDIGAAVLKEDPFFYLVSLAGFIKTFSSLVFIINKQFEPSGRGIYRAIMELPLLPEHFKGRYESICGDDPDLTPHRKAELAGLLLKSLLSLASGVSAV